MDNSIVKNISENMSLGIIKMLKSKDVLLLAIKAYCPTHVQVVSINTSSVQSLEGFSHL